MKRFCLFFALCLAAFLFSGCAGTPVVYHGGCTCPGDSQAPAASQAVPAGGALKTGLAVVADISGSESAKQADYDVTIVAVTVDDGGVIRECVIDSLSTQVAFDGTGTITSDLAAQIKTKNELGASYGMKTYGGAKYEWYEQAAALADYAEGKTVEQLKSGAVDESGRAPGGSDLASSATIYLGGYVDAIEKAVANARHLGARSGDGLKLASISSVGSSTGADAQQEGTAQLDCDVTALTVQDGVITSCVIDSLQAKVHFDSTGAITSDLTAGGRTKNELGKDYGMVAWGQASFEWNEQAANFASYVTGKTAEQVAGIAVSGGKPADADLASSVTITIGGFQQLIAKAMGK